MIRISRPWKNNEEAKKTTQVRTNRGMRQKARLSTAPVAGKDSIGIALSMEDIVGSIMEYVPFQQQHRSCSLVSRIWNRVVGTVNSMPLVLHIEDTLSKPYSTKTPRIRRRKESRTSNHDDANNDDHVLRFPLHAIGNLPPAIAFHTKTLILVLRFLPQYTDKYNLDDFSHYGGKPSPFLHRFPNIEDLTIVTEYASDQFVSILSSTTISIPSLKRIRYEETNVSSWRSSHLETFVRLAPNLEVLELRENMFWGWTEDNKYFRAEDISELLPLSNSLRQLVLFNRENIGGNFAQFLRQMPLLVSWDICCWRIDFHGLPLHQRRTMETLEDNTCHPGVNRNEFPHYLLFFQDEVDFFRTMQDIVVLWFVGLDDPCLHPWRFRIPSMIGYLDALVREYFGSVGRLDRHFFLNRPNRPYRLPTLQNLLEVDPRMTLPTAHAGLSRNTYASYCSPSRKAIKLLNYKRVFRPCMEIYRKEFVHYSNLSNFGDAAYNRFQYWHQRMQLNRLLRRIVTADSHHRWKGSAVFSTFAKPKDFRTLV